MSFEPGRYVSKILFIGSFTVVLCTCFEYYVYHTWEQVRIKVIDFNMMEAYEQCSIHPGCLFDIGDDIPPENKYGPYKKPI